MHVLTPEKRKLLLDSYPFVKTFIEGKIKYEEYAQNMSAFKSELTSKGFSEDDFSVLLHPSEEVNEKHDPEYYRNYVISLFETDSIIGLSKRISHLLKMVADMNAEFVKHDAVVRDSLAKMDQMYNAMNWRERRLGGWFGGDKAKVKAYNEEERRYYETNHIRVGFMNDIKRIEKHIKKIMEQHMRIFDAGFCELEGAYNKTLDMLNVVDEALNSVDRALDALDSADSAETLDFFSKSKTASVISKMSADDAEDYIRIAKRRVEKMNGQLQEYNKSFREYKLPKKVDTDISDNLDFMFDLVASPSFDLFSIFRLSSMDEVESGLKEVREYIASVRETVAAHNKKALENMQNYVANIRKKLE